MKLERNIIAPVCIFFIGMGAAGIVILPIVNVFFEFSREKYNLIFEIIWIISAITALLYSLIMLREFLKKSLVEKILYWLLATVFTALAFMPLFR